MADPISIILSRPAKIEWFRGLILSCKRTERGCIEWPGPRNGAGYGIVGSGRGVQGRAHRLAWAVTNGMTSPGDLCVCHRCDNPACFNPAHLFVGTKRDNTRDMMAKGRMVPPPVHRGDSHPLRARPETAMRGERNGMARLSAGQAAEIYQSTLTCTAAQRRYGVSESTILDIRAGRTWRHVTGHTNATVRRGRGNGARHQ